MFSFLILVMWNLISVIYSAIQDIKNNNYKYLWKWITAIILFLILAYLKSINL